MGRFALRRPGLLLLWVLSALAGMLAAAAVGRLTDNPPPAQAGAPGSALVVGQPGQYSTLAPNGPAPVSLSLTSPTCTLPVRNTATCYLKWSGLAATAPSGEYMITMTVSIDDQLRAYVGGFFQNSMGLPADMFGAGFRVSCGAPGAGGDPQLGASYRWLVAARATGGGPVAQNGGSVYCPADIAREWLPFVGR